MLARATERRSDDTCADDDIARTMPGEFFVEDKFDGIRAQATSRTGGRDLLKDA